MTKFGLRPGGEGWFVVNAREMRWRDTGGLGAFCDFEGKRRFPGLGINLNVLQPGQPMGLYHRESRQEDFLVLAGECLLIVDGEERELKTWDLFHSPPGTEHIIVGAGTGRPSCSPSAHGVGAARASSIRSRRSRESMAPVSRPRRRARARRTKASRAGSGRRTRRAGYPSSNLGAGGEKPEELASGDLFDALGGAGAGRAGWLGR